MALKAGDKLPDGKLMESTEFDSGTQCAMPPNEVNVAEAAKGKTDIQAALKASFDYCDAALKEASDQKTPARPMISLVASLNEHYGNLVGYLRAKGVVPPSTARASKNK